MSYFRFSPVLSILSSISRGYELEILDWWLFPFTLPCCLTVELTGSCGEGWTQDCGPTFARFSIGRSRLGVYPALLSYSRVFSIGRSRLGVTIHGHMIYGGWQDSRLVLSILTSISRGYELDSWAFPGLILYGSLTD